MPFKSGYVAIVGRPNAGKSTLLNSILGERLSIVTSKPQTTRHRIAGIHNEDGAQIVFLDTPGYHFSEKTLNKVMVNVVEEAIGDADVICLLVSADQNDTDIEEKLFKKIGSAKCVLVVNKSDLISPATFDGIAKKYRDGWGAREIVILSALTGMGVKTFIEAIKERLPEGHPFFETDIYTDRNMRFIAGELIREEVFIQMQQEIPYSTAVVVDEFKEPTESNPVTKITASIVVEKESQKGMIIGQGGKRIKNIGKASRLKIEKMIGGKVFLELFVKVDENWTKDHERIKEFGY